MRLALPVNSTNVRNLLGFWADRIHLRVAAAIAPDAAIEKAARLFSSPPRIPHPPRELELLATGRAFTVRDGALELRAWRFGPEGRPVVVLSHGWAGRGAQLRSFVAPLVDAGYQVVLFDHVGHGHSGGFSTTLVHFVQGLDAVVRHLESHGDRIAGLVGHSLGAAAAGAWLNGSGRTIRTVLLAPPTSLQRYSVFFAQRFGIPEGVRLAMQQRFERTLGRAWASFELPQSVAQVKAPGLVIQDRDDREVRPSGALALSRAWPGARFSATQGLGHRGVLRDETVVRDVVDFIADRVVFAPPPAVDAHAFHQPSPLL